MMSEKEVRQLCADLELVQKRPLGREAIMCVSAAHGAVKAILGEAEGCGPAKIILELRQVTMAAKAKQN